MKPKERFFFFLDTSSSENCYTLDYYLDESLAEDSTFEIRGASILYGEGFFYCDKLNEVGDSGDLSCGILCEHYKPRNGKNGRCVHHKNCYEPNGNIYVVSKGKVIDKKIKEL